MFSKKALGPVVAVALLLVVSVTAVIGFQTWFQGYSSNLYTNSESQSTALSEANLEIEGVIDGFVYVNSRENSSLDKIEVNDVECDVISLNLTKGVQRINISSCLENLTTSTPDIVLVSEKGIVSRKFYVENAVVSSSTEDTPVNYFATSSCITIDSSVVENYSEVRLTSPINDHSGTCFDFDVDDVVFNCQNNLVDGDSSGTDFGFDLSNQNNITLLNCRVTEFYNGVTSSAGGPYYFDNVEFSFNTHNGIDFYPGSGANGVYNDVITNNNTDYGMLLRNTNYINFTNAQSNGNGLDGIALWNSDYGNYSNLELNDNGRYGLQFYDSDDYNVIYNLTSNNNADEGIFFRNNVKGVEVSDSSFVNNSGYGALFSRSSNNSITGSYFEGNTNGDLRLDGEVSNADNLFYLNSFSSSTNISSGNWSVNNSFSLASPVLGNLWRDFGVCSTNSTQLYNGNTYTYCTNPANYTVNALGDNVDFGPLVEWDYTYNLD